MKRINSHRRYTANTMKEPRRPRTKTHSWPQPRAARDGSRPNHAQCIVTCVPHSRGLGGRIVDDDGPCPVHFVVGFALRTLQLVSVLAVLMMVVLGESPSLHHKSWNT